MKKRVMSALLALCLCLTLLPVSAGAAYTPPIEVGAVSLSVPAPVAGGKLEEAKPAAASGAPYFVSSSRWTRVVAEGGMADADDWTAWNGSFQADSWYWLSIELMLDYGYFYAGSVTAQISGANPAQVQVERDGDDTVYVNAWFQVGSPAAAAEIGSVQISNVPTARVEQVTDWTNAIKAAAVSDGCRISDAYLYAWDSAENYWSICYRDESTDAGKVYGARLTVSPLPGHAFGAAVTAGVNGEAAEITAQSMDEVEIFVPFGTVTVSSVSVSSKTWPIDGNPIRNGPENFSGGSAYGGYTLESAQFQIQDKGHGEYRNLTAADTTFSWQNNYRVTAVLKAKSYAAFADTVTGSFNGTSGTVCQVTDNGKTCTVTRTCAVYDPVYTFPANDPNNHINGITIYRDDPVAGAGYTDDAFSPDGESIRLSGATGTYEWHEVSCVGSSYSLKKLTKGDAFEAGKVYYAPMWLRADGDNNRRFDDNFTVSFKQRSGADIGCARLECVQDNASVKRYDIWYTVGDAAQTPITQVAVTGPEYQNGTIDTSDPTAFQTSDPVTISSPYFYSYVNQLSFHITAKSGYYFGRTVTVTYNGKAAEVSNALFFYGDRFTAKEVRVSCDITPAIQLTVSGITAESKTYDGTTAATLTGGTLDGVEANDQVILDLSDAKAEFDSKDVGADQSVTVKGVLKLTGRDAYKYALTQPELTDLKADITACPDFTDATDKNQTIYVGGSSFEAPRFTGVTVNGAPEAVTGDVAYTLGGEAKTAAQLGEALKALKAGEKLDIGYTFTADRNYSGEKTGTITVTARDSAVPDIPYVPAPAYPVNLPEGTPNGALSASAKSAPAGSLVIITVKPDPGFRLDSLTAADRSGSPLPLADRGNGAYSFTMPAGGVTVSAVFVRESGQLFADVPADAYYYKAVEWAAGLGITGGVGGGLFAPDDPCTRAQIVTLLWRAAGSPEPVGTQSFTDVPAGSYYEKAVAWAIENGVTTGTGEGRFSPEDPCTRAQAVTLLSRALKAKAAGAAAFLDVPAGSYFADAVAWALENGVTTGTGEGKFSPEDPCTRAQIVTFLWRAYSK